MKVSSNLAGILARISVAILVCNMHQEVGAHEKPLTKVVVTSPMAMDVIITQEYVGKIQLAAPHRRSCPR